MESVYIDRWFIVKEHTGYGLMPLFSQADWEQQEVVNLKGTERMLFDNEDNNVCLDKNYNSIFVYFQTF